MFMESHYFVRIPSAYSRQDFDRTALENSFGLATKESRQINLRQSDRLHLMYAF